MASDFKIGTDTSSNFYALDAILDSDVYPGDPDWSFRPYSVSTKLNSGLFQGNGFPIAKWRWNAMNNEDRETLKAYVSTALSASLYIQTATNTSSSGVIQFKKYSCIMNWSDQDEDFQADKTIGLIVIFTHLVYIP
jgi:hypothetical protein